MNTNLDLSRSYELFLSQKKLFVSKLRQIDKNVRITIDPQKPNINTPGNWFMGFVPSEWGDFEHGMHGVHFEFAYFREPESGNEYVRFSLGVENPFKEMYRDQFKGEVVEMMKSVDMNLPDFTIWPQAGVIRGRKLIEYRATLDDHAGEKVIEKYKDLINIGFIGLVAETIERYRTMEAI